MGQFNLLLSNLDAFNFFLLLNCSGWISGTILNRNVESGHPHPAPDIRGKLQHFFTECNVNVSLLYSLR
jgi:hypothetical protein